MAYPRLHAISVSRVKVRGIYHITPYQSASAVFSSAENRAETSLVRWGQFRWKDGVSHVDGVNRQLLGGQPLLFRNKAVWVTLTQHPQNKSSWKTWIVIANLGSDIHVCCRKDDFRCLQKGASRFRNSKSFLVTPVWLAKTKLAVVCNVFP